MSETNTPSPTSVTSNRSKKSNKLVNTQDSNIKTGPNSNTEYTKQLSTQGKVLPNYSEKKAKLLKYEEIFDIITKHHSRQTTKNTQQALLYTEHILRKIINSEKIYEEMIKNKDKTIDDLNQVLQDQDKKIEELQLYRDCRKEVLSQKEITAEQQEAEITLIEQLEKTISKTETINSQLQTKIQSLQSIIEEKDNEVKILKEELNNEGMDQKQQTSAINEAQIIQQNKDLKEEVLNQENKVYVLSMQVNSLREENSFIKEEFTRKNQEINLIQDMYNTLKEQMTFLTEIQHNKHLEKSTYADITTSNSNKEFPALVITPNQDLSLTDLKNKINSIHDERMGIKSCKTTTAGNMVIQCETETQIEKLKEKIIQKEDIPQTIKITNKRPAVQKIIIFSIPVSVAEEELEKTIKDKVPTIKHYSPIKKQEKTYTYHQTIELDSYSASMLLKISKLLIRFNSCPVQKYISTRRCHRCQRLGHTSTNCIKVAKEKNAIYSITCEYCGERHASIDCPIKDDPSKYKCINCNHSNSYGSTTYNINHATSSRECNSFLDVLQEERKAYHSYLRSARSRK